MATTDQELKTLNKTVNEAVNILKLYVGNSAQVKAMNEKEREVIDKWLTVTDMAEENQKRQRAFTERARDKHGRFIKKREGAWGKFLDMAESSMKFFNKVTFGIAGKIKNMVMGIAGHFTKFFHELKSHFLSLFGEESEWFGLITSIKDSIVSTTKGIWTFIFGTTPKWAGNQLKILKKMYDLQMKQFKLGFLKKKKTIQEMGWGEILAVVLGGLVGGLAGWLKDRLSTLTGLFTLATFTPQFKKLKAGLLALKESKWLKWVDDIPFLGKWFKRLAFGFKWLVWPLSILMSMMDFYQGYSKTEGSQWDKIREGLWNIIDDFIELPLDIFLNLTKLIMKAFGEDLDIDKLKKQWMDAMHEGWNFILSGDFIKPLMNALKSVFNKFADMWNSLLEGLASKIENVPGFGGIAESLRGSTIEKMHLDYSTKDNAYQSANKLKALELSRGIDVSKIEQRQAVQDNLKKSMEEGAKKREAQKEELLLNKAMKGVGNMFRNVFNNNSQGGGEARQIPDEIDHTGAMGFQTYNGSND